MVMACRWIGRVVTLLVVMMMSMGPFAQGLDAGQFDHGELLWDTLPSDTDVTDHTTPLDGPREDGPPLHIEDVRESMVMPFSDNSSYEAFPPVMFATWGNKIHLFYPNKDNTGYGDKVVIDMGVSTSSGVFDDFDRDGYLDLFVACMGNVDSYILWGNEDDNWSKVDSTRITASTNDCVGAYTGDFNGDGYPDIVCQCRNSPPGRVTNIFLNNGDGTFDRYANVNITTTTTQHGGFELDTGDLNNDGYDDVVTAGRCYFGGPNGPDATADISLHSLAQQDALVYDMDEDGYKDVVFSLTDLSGRIYLGGSDGPDTTVDYTLTLSTSPHPWPGAGDLNSDGYVDLIFAGGGIIQVFKGTTQGWSNSNQYTISTSYHNGGIKVVDVDKDGYDDILLGIVGSDFRVYFGGTSWPTSPDISKSGLGSCWDVMGIAIPRGASVNATLPSEPQNLTVGSGDRSIHLSWDAPNDTGGVRLGGYNIYRGPRVNDLTKINWVGRNQKEYIDHPPQTGIEYRYAVTTFNVKGESNRSEIMNVTNTGRPLAPMGMMLTPGCNTISINWEPPTDTGGFPILGYRLHRGKTSMGLSHHADLTNVTEYMDEGLENGQEYYYQLLAFNLLGDGPLSGLCSAIPVGPPSRPQYLTIRSWDSTIEIEWRAPASDGGNSIIGYRIFRGSSDDLLDPIGMVDDSVKTYMDTGLTNGVTYHYAVRALNEIGDSPLSNMVNATPIGLPGMPLDLQLVATDGQVTLSWDPPEATGGTIILRYQIFRGATEDSIQSLDCTNAEVTTFTDTGLKNGHTLHYTVCAVNKVGDGPHTEVLAATPLALPDAPGDLIAEAGNGIVIITWLRSMDDGGSEIARYVIYRGTSAGSLQHVHTMAKSRFTYEDEDVLVGTTYYYAVAAVTAAGEGPRSTVASATPYGPPSKPLDLVATSGDGEVRLTWSAPEEDGANTIIGYVVMRGDTPASISELAQLATVTSYLDTSVTNGETYHYTVAAINEAGPGEQTDIAPATPLRLDTEPGRVLGLVGETNSAKVTLQWSAPTDDGGSPVTGYVVMRGESWDDLQVVATLGVVTSWTDEDAQRGRTYYYSVCAVNDVGQGEPCATFEVKVPKKAEESPGFQVVAVMAALLLIVSWVRHKRFRT